MSLKVWCDDWRCPARVSCKHHYGRSAAYAGMKPGAKVESVENTGQFNWSVGPDAGLSCEVYRLDKPKPWLMPQPGQATHGEAA